jgi:hypothetical protein
VVVVEGGGVAIRPGAVRVRVPAPEAKQVGADDHADDGFVIVDGSSLDHIVLRYTYE